MNLLKAMVQKGKHTPKFYDQMFFAYFYALRKPYSEKFVLTFKSPAFNTHPLISI
jgi:hypothetical protein